MNKYLKEFFIRGMLFSGFGPIILGIVYFILQKTVSDFSLSGGEVALGIISIYVLAFIQAGSTVFYLIEDWPITKSVFFHFFSLYLIYILCYILNTWIPFKIEIILIFTGIFVGVYALVWLAVVLIIKTVSFKMNKGLNS